MKPRWKLFAFIYSFALFIRFAAVFLTRFQIQDVGYLGFAQNLINHGKFFEVIQTHGVGQAWNGAYWANCPPLYPFFIALFSNHIFLLSIWQSLIYSFLPLVVYHIAENLFFDKKTAMVSALICCAYPYFVYSSNQLVDTGLACLTFGLILLFNLIYAQENSTKHLFVVGAVNAMGLLTRQNFLSVILVFPLFYLFIFQDKIQGLVFRKYLLLFSVTFLFISPWLARNYLILKEPVITSYYGPYTLWLGNNKLTNKYLSMGVVAHIEDYVYFEKVEEKDLGYFENLNEVEKGKWLTRRAINFIESNPIVFLENAYLKFIRLWAVEKEYSPLDQNPGESPEESKLKNLTYFAITFPLFLLSSLGLVILFKQKKRLGIFFLILFAAYSIPFMVYISAIRMRIPFDILLIILLSFFIIWMMDLAATFFRLKSS